MSIVVLSVATLVAFLTVQFVYSIVTAVVGSAVGTAAKVISVGVGPPLYKLRIGRIEYRLSLIPTGSYTTFLSDDEPFNSEDPEEFLRHDFAADPVPFSTLPLASKAIVTGSGPCSVIAIGLALLAAGLWIDGSKVVVSQAAQAQLSPTAVPSLAVTGERATVESHYRLFLDSYLEFWKRILTFSSLSGWGAFVGWIVTCGVAAKHSIGAWLTCFGVGCVGTGLLNLVPIPPLPCGVLLANALQSVFGAVSDSTLQRVYKVLILMTLGVFAIMVFIDIKWLATVAVR